MNVAISLSIPEGSRPSRLAGRQSGCTPLVIHSLCTLQSAKSVVLEGNLGRVFLVGPMFYIFFPRGIICFPNSP